MKASAPLCAVVVAGLLAACSSATGTPVASVAKASAGSAPSPSGSSDMANMDMAASSAQAWGPAPSSAVESALRLEALLGQHSILAADMMRARIRGDADLAQTANAALTDNTQAMSAVLAPVVGARGASQFSTLWAEHVRELFSYASALSGHDTAAQRSTVAALTAYEDKLAAFFVSASHGRLTQKAAHAAVKEHIEHLVKGAKAYSEKRYTTSANLYRMSYTHTFGLGAVLAAAILGPAVAKQLKQPDVQLRTSLTEVLGEHVALVIGAMRSAVGDPADFKAMGAAVNQNTLELTAAIDSLFGSKAAKGFQQYWADHVDELMKYTSAAVKGDTAGQDAYRQKLRTFETGFGAFMNTATENRLGAKALVAAFVSHDRMLLAEIDAYTAQNYQQAQDLAYQTYTSMFTVSAQLAGAIGATIASTLPQGGSQTGGGWLAVNRR